MKLPGFKTLLIGEPGDGKTHAIRTLQAAGVQPLVLATEPGVRALRPCENPACVICKGTREAPEIPWAYVAPSPGDIDILIKQAQDVNKFDLKALCNINDTRRGDYDQFVQVLKLYKEFVDSTGKSWGPVNQWGTDRALVVDSWSSLGPMAMNLFCGRRPVYDKSDYQVAQKGLFNFWLLLTCQTNCHVVVIGHLERNEFADTSRQSKLTVLTIGQKLAPDLPAKVDDMIYAVRRGDKFSWTVIDTGVVSKARNLPLKGDLPPDFRPLVESWKRAGGIIIPTTMEPNT